MQVMDLLKGAKRLNWTAVVGQSSRVHQVDGASEERTLPPAARAGVMIHVWLDPTNKRVFNRHANTSDMASF